MRFLTFCSVLLFCIGAILTGNVNRDSKPNEKDTFLEEIESEYKDQWITWKKLYGKEYTDFNEEITKFSIWLNNLRFVIKHNLDASLNRSSFTTALNEYSDLSTYDIRKKMNGANVNVKQDLLTTSEKVFTKPENLEIPDKIDWRDSGYVTEVKSQGQCSAGYAFSAAGALEGQNFRSTGKLVTLSAQNLIDCSMTYGNKGCEGGAAGPAFLYVRDNKGIDTAEGYPYYERELGYCYYQEKYNGGTATGYTNVIKDEEELKAAVATIGPISALIDASPKGFQKYSGGVFDDPTCSPYQLNHGVLIVGYGSENGLEYWLVKNSWGASWGEKGYVKLARNKNNQCGIASAASYPNV